MIRFIKKWNAFLVVIFLAGGYLCTQPALLDISIFNDDNRIHLAGFFHLDREYKHFSDDLLSSSMQAFTPPGYRLVFYLLTPFLSILVIPKIIQVVCFLLYLFFGYKVGCSMLGKWGGVISVCFMITGTFTMGRIAGGNPRALGPVLYMALLYFLITRNYKGMLWNAFVGALFYPQAMIVSILTFLIMNTRELHELGLKKFYIKHNHKCILFAFIILLIFAILIPFSLDQNRKFGEMYSFSEAKNHPSWQRGGRLGSQIPIPNFLRVVASCVNNFKHMEVTPFYRISNTAYWRKVTSWNRERGYPVVTICYVIIPLILWMFGLFRFPKEIIYYCLALLVAYILSCMFAFKLYGPSKFLLYPIGVLFSQYIIIGVGYGCNNRDRDKNISKGILIVLAIFIIESCFYGTGIRKNNQLRTNVRPYQASLFSYIQNFVDKDKIIAGKLEDMDSIPLFARRKVLLSLETATPRWKKLNEKIVMPRASIISKAYFADSPEPLSELKRKFNADYFLVDKRDFSRDTYPDNFTITPYKKSAKKMFIKNKAKYYLDSANIKSVAYEDARYKLIDLNKE